MTAFTYDADGIPRCQILIDGKPCNGFLLLTQDSRYLTCERLHGKLFPVDSDQADLVRQAYRNRDTPSPSLLKRRWKETLLVAVKIGTFTKTACDLGVVRKERVTAYQIAEAMYKVVNTATQSTKASGLEVVACAVSKSGSRSVKLFAPLALTQEQIEKLKKQGSRNDQGRTCVPVQ